MSVSVQYNKLRKRIKVTDFTDYYKVDDIAYHMLCGQTLNIDAINELLNTDDEWFVLAIENAINVLDLNEEV